MYALPSQSTLYSCLLVATDHLCDYQSKGTQELWIHSTAQEPLPGAPFKINIKPSCAAPEKSEVSHLGNSCSVYGVCAMKSAFQAECSVLSSLNGLFSHGVQSESKQGEERAVWLMTTSSLCVHAC